jgi:hypothetical protein
LCPQITSYADGVDARILPPPCFIAAAMNLSMVLAAQRDREFVAHLSPEGPRLGKPEMMGIGGFSTADEARLRGHELAMAFVTEATWLGHDRAGCGWEVRCWRGNRGRIYLSCCRYYVVAGRVSSGRSDDCHWLLAYRETSHLGLESVFDDPSIVRRERILGRKTLAGPGNGVVRC